MQNVLQSMLLLTNKTQIRKFEDIKRINQMWIGEEQTM